MRSYQFIVLFLIMMWTSVVWAGPTLVHQDTNAPISIDNSSPTSAPVQVRRPNIIVIMIDDFGAELLKCYGGESYETPHIDVLAAQGVRFGNAYSTPQCTSTRVQIMSGLYPCHNGWSYGIWHRAVSDQIVPPRLLRLGTLMKTAGYKTAVAGKWQLARLDAQPEHPSKCGFDEWCLWTWQYNGKKTSRYWQPHILRNDEIINRPEGVYGPDIHVQFIVDFIKRHRSEPFFIYYPMTLVHGPFVAPPNGTSEDNVGHFKEMVTYVDDILGRIVSVLDEIGVRDDTLVILTADNGSPTSFVAKYKGELIKGGKVTLTEAGTRVPFIASWPNGIEKGLVVDDLIDLTDVLPTIAQAAGAKLLPHWNLDGRSVLPQMRGEKGKARKFVYVQLRKKWYIRNKNYRVHSDGSFYDVSQRYREQLIIHRNETQQQIYISLMKLANDMRGQRAGKVELAEAQAIEAGKGKENKNPG